MTTIDTAIAQHQASKLVATDVLLNMNGFIEGILQDDGHDEYENVMNIASREDYQEPVNYHIFTEMDREQLKETLEAEGFSMCASDSSLKLSHALFEHVKSEDGFQEFAESHSLEPEHNEALEFWAVSTWLSGQLKERGEMIEMIHDVMIWGRTCSGQAILMDRVIQEITKDLKGDNYGKE